MTGGPAKPGRLSSGSSPLHLLCSQAQVNLSVSLIWNGQLEDLKVKYETLKGSLPWLWPQCWATGTLLSPTGGLGKGLSGLGRWLVGAVYLQTALESRRGGPVVSWSVTGWVSWVLTHTTVSSPSLCTVWDLAQVLCPRQEGRLVGALPHPHTPPPFDGEHNRCSSATAREHSFQEEASRALLLSKIKVTGLLDKVPVDLGCSHIEVWGVNSFIQRK